MVPKTEYQREQYNKYFRRYRKEHPEIMKAKDAKYDQTHRGHRNRHYREKWKNDPLLRVKRCAYFKQLRLDGIMGIHEQRHMLKIKIKNKEIDKKMHISTRLIKYTTKMMDLVNPDDLKSTADIKYWEQIKLRLEASILLAKAWNKEFKDMGGEE